MVSLVQAKHNTFMYPVSLSVSIHRQKHHSLALYSKVASSNFLQTTAPSLHTRVTTASHVTTLTRKHSPFPLTFLLPSLVCDVTHHKYITTSIHIQNLCTVQQKQKRYWDFDSFPCCLLQGRTSRNTGINYYYVLQLSRHTKNQLSTEFSNTFFMVCRHQS